MIIVFELHIVFFMAFQRESLTNAKRYPPFIVQGFKEIILNNV